MIFDLGFGFCAGLPSDFDGLPVGTALSFGLVRSWASVPATITPFSLAIRHSILPLAAMQVNIGLMDQVP
jgi:hypothetical protein